MVTIIVVVAVVVLVALWLIVGYNGLVAKKAQCDEAFATMDVYMKKRFDLIPNLVSTVKGYAKHEAETLEKVIEARNAGGRSQSQVLSDEQQVSGALKSIFALGEAYPDLKANTTFIELQEKLTECENDIAQSRKFYNAVVKKYNVKTMQFPSNILAGMFHFTKLDLFEVDDASERKNVKVEF